MRLVQIKSFLELNLKNKGGLEQVIRYKFNQGFTSLLIQEFINRSEFQIHKGVVIVDLRFCS